MHFYRIALSAGSLGILGLIAGACSLAVDVDSLRQVPQTPDAGDASVCAHASYPSPPAKDEPANPPVDIDFTVASRSIDLGDTGNIIGLDIDRTCTCQNEGPSCTYPPSSANEDHCDAPEGRDNGSSMLIKTIGDFLGGSSAFGTDYFTNRAEQGGWSLLIRVSNYNGGPNDTQVRLATYTTKWDDAGQTPTPTWNGSDVWRVSGEALEDGVNPNNPKYKDDNAYVSNYIVVSSLPELVIKMDGASGDLGLRLTAGTIMGRIEKTSDGKYKIVDGIVAARWKTSNIFSIASTININDQPLCNDGGLFYSSFKKLVCKRIDIATQAGAASVPCDAVSFGMNFNSEPVLLGEVYTPTFDPSPCAPGQDPGDDSCN